jgi:hypothetical protein
MGRHDAFLSDRPVTRVTPPPAEEGRVLRRVACRVSDRWRRVEARIELYRWSTEELELALRPSYRKRAPHEPRLTDRWFAVAHEGMDALAADVLVLAAGPHPTRGADVNRGLRARR